VENVDTMNDLILSHKGVLKCISGDRPSSLASVQHFSSGFSLKCLKKRRAQEL